MQQSYRQFLVTASSDTDFISFGDYEYTKTMESTRPRAKNVGRSGALQRGSPCQGTIGTMVNSPLGGGFRRSIRSQKRDPQTY